MFRRASKPSVQGPKTDPNEESTTSTNLQRLRGVSHRGWSPALGQKAKSQREPRTAEPARLRFLEFRKMDSIQ